MSSLTFSKFYTNGLFKATCGLEKLRFRDEWTRGLISKIQDRLEHPRFCFPGVNDRAPPPPKTLHWRHAPQKGEYDKMKAILSWGALHIYLLEERIGGTPYSFLIEHGFDYLNNELISRWLPEASIPAFSIKGEAKLLTGECRDFCKSLKESCEDEQVFQSRLFEGSLRYCGLTATDPILGDLLRYVEAQRRLLLSLSEKEVVENSRSWAWNDSNS